MIQVNSGSDFFQYLLSLNDKNHDEKIPSLQDLSKELNISVSSLREQLEVAKALGFVEVKPRTGIRRLPYSFFPAVIQSISYAIKLEIRNFRLFAELRNHVEEAFWYQATKLLETQDHLELKLLVNKAVGKLNGTPIQIPHIEHRQLHMNLYKRLDNPFVLGILEAFWEVYEAVGYSMYADHDYLMKVWEYHGKMVDALGIGEYEAGYQALVSHKDLLFYHPVNKIKNTDEIHGPLSN